MNKQTILGKVLGWTFGIILTLSVFSVFDKEIGLFGLGIGIIGILLLPPVNMKLRNKYRNFIVNKYGEKYGENIINFAYASIKIVLGFMFLFVLAMFCASNSEVINNTNNESQQLNNIAKKVEQQATQTELQHKKESKPKVSREFKNALIKAETYSRTMHMSKRRIYEQLVSEYGEHFPADAAQYAIDSLNENFEYNALQTAKTYQSSMNMSKQAIYDQLISEYGEKFTAKEAQYAIDHLED